MISDILFMSIAKQVAKASKANRKKVGCILVNHGNIIAIGYNGTPSGFDNCCEKEGITKKNVLHAESNAIAKCSRSNSSSDGAQLYCTLSPCLECSKIIIQAGVSKVFYSEKYDDTSGLELLKQAKIDIYEI